MAGDDLVVKNLREKCTTDNVRRIIGNIKSLDQMLNLMDHAMRDLKSA
jgi:hypothetical protein